MKNNIQNDALDSTENAESYIENALQRQIRTQKELQEKIDKDYQADLDYEQDLPIIYEWFNLIPPRGFVVDILMRYVASRYPSTRPEDIWKEVPEETFQVTLAALNNLFVSIQDSADRNGYITYNLIDSRRRAREVERAKMEDDGYPYPEDIEGLDSLPF